MSSLRSIRRFAGGLGLALLSLPVAAQPAPPSSSALGRWWRARGPIGIRITSDERGLVLLESGRGQPERVYQTWKDARGEAHEAYWEDGAAKPVDAPIHAWAHARLQEAERVPTPLAAPVPPEPPAPPQPPLPKPLTPGEAGAAALSRAQQNLHLQTTLGSPITIGATAQGCVETWSAGEPKGWLHFTHQAGATVDLTFALEGPKGRALLHAKGGRRGAVWTFTVLDLLPPGGARLNLLRP